MRDYGTGDKPLVLVLKPSPKGGVMRILVIRKGGGQVEQVPVTLRFGDKRQSAHLLSYSDEKKRLRVTAINVPIAEFKSNAGAATIALDGGRYHEIFAVSQLPKVIAELDACLVDLQDYWNIGDRHEGRIAKPVSPRQPLEKLFSGSDYPSLALRQAQQGSVLMTFLVDEQGEVKDCTVDETSGVPVLDTMSCFVIHERARFEPALGQDRKPIRSAYTKRVTWRIAGVSSSRPASAPRR